MPAVLALLPALMGLAPQIAQWLGGSKAEATATAVTGAITSITGIANPTPADIAGLDPATAAQLRQALAKIAADNEQAQRQADIDTLKAVLADTANARAQTIALTQAGSAIAWGAPVISLVVLVTFGVVMYFVITKTLPQGSETILNVLLGMLGVGFTSVINYWTGSSNGSQKKDATIANATTLLGNSTPVK